MSDFDRFSNKVEKMIDATYLIIILGFLGLMGACTILGIIITKLIEAGL